MPDEIKQVVSVDAQQAKAELNAISEAERKQVDAMNAWADSMRKATDKSKDMGDATKKLTRDTDEQTKKTKESKDANEELGASFSLVKGQVMGLIGSMTGGLGLAQLYQQYREELAKTNEMLKEHARLTRDAAEARLDLVALSGFESKEDVAFINQTATFAGRNPAEVARTMTTFRSQFPNATDAQVRELTQMTAAQAQQTGAAMTSLAAPIALLFNQTGGAKPASNILNEAITQAGEPDPAKLGQIIGKVSPSMVSLAKMSPAEAAGNAAALTGLGMANEVAATGAERAVIALFGKAATEGVGAEIIARENIDTKTFRSGMSGTLEAYRAGRISNAEMEQWFGAEGLRYMAALAPKEKEAAYWAKTDAVVAASKRDDLIIAQKAQGIFGAGGSESQRLNLLSKQAEAGTEAIKGGDVKALKIATVRSVLANVLAQAVQQGHMNKADADAKLEKYDELTAKGMDPRLAADRAEAEKAWFSDLKMNPELGLLAAQALQIGPSLQPGQSMRFNLVPAQTTHFTRPFEGDPNTAAELSDYLYPNSGGRLPQMINIVNNTNSITLQGADPKTAEAPGRRVP